MSTPESLSHKKQPMALYMLFFVEMWERFSYYGMRALLVLFIVSPIIGYSEKAAGHIYGWFAGLVYFTPVVGGYLADRYLGRKNSIILGAIIMAMGQFALASYGYIPPKMALWIGLFFLIVGNGFFKPNISAIVGDLYEENDPRRDGGFTIFYMGINVGAFFSPLVCSTLGERGGEFYSRLGFVAAGVGMLISLVWFVFIKDRFLKGKGERPGSAKAIEAQKAVVEAGGKAVSDAPLTQEEKDRIKAIFIFVFFAIFFFAFFEQAGSSLTLFARDAIDRTVNIPGFLAGASIFGKTIPAVWEVPVGYFQSLNPMFVVLLAPIFAVLWKKLGDRDLSIPAKFSVALFLLGAGYVVILIAARIFTTTGAMVAMAWLAALYLLHTMGELCLSPVGLSMITKLAPAKFTSLFMGVWLTSSFFGNILGGWLAGTYTKEGLVQLFTIPAVLSLVFAVIMMIMTKKTKYWMHGVK
ncbi:POT family proton-dependent oligopeptide transporter [Elusimicrobium posterum]|uniref:peptide MFS transporter n=1 Tax=Elusimicrobium posterum TaxID=3116653 RepID=UPI003C735B22